MSIRDVPPAVRVQLYLFWAGMVVAGIGVVGFFLSFWEVGSSAAASIDVHDDVPVFAYASIAAWVAGLAAMWGSRRKLDAAVAAKLAQDREGLFVEDFGSDPVSGVSDSGQAPAVDGVPATASTGRDT